MARIMKTLVLGLCLFIGCEDPPSEWRGGNDVVSLNKMDVLKDCTYTAFDTGGAYIRVVRCPNSSTTTHYNCGKNCYQNVTVTENDKKDCKAECMKSCGTCLGSENKVEERAK